MTTAREHLASILTPTDALSVNDEGVLEIAGVAADELVKEFGSPLYVLAEPTLRDNYRRLRDAFASRWPEDVVVLYAIKSNNNIAVRALMHQEGAGGDCFGDGELHATFAGGADARTVALNGSNKLPDHIREGVRLGVCFNVDGNDELELIAAEAAAQGTVARVCLRLKVFAPEFDLIVPTFRPDQGALTKELVEGQWGMSPELVEQLTLRALELEQIEFEGYQSHIGRESTDPSFHTAYARAFGRSVVQLTERTGCAPRVLDLGGGFARERDPESRSLELNAVTIEDYAEAVITGLLEGLEGSTFALPELWLEPGRYLAGNAGVLLTTVGSVKRDLGRVWSNVDASINNLMRAETGGFAYHVLPADRMDSPADATLDIVGSLCTGHAMVSDRRLPDPVRDDVIAFLDAGMYAETASTQFNGMPRPATVLVADGTAELIKRRESVQDVFGLHVVPERLQGLGTRRAVRHVPASETADWKHFGAADATHDALEALSASADTDARWLHRRNETADRPLPSQSGLYRMQPCEFDFVSPGDQTSYVLDGRAEVRLEGGPTLELHAGDMVFYPHGTRSHWTVLEPFTEFFTMIG